MCMFTTVAYYEPDAIDFEYFSQVNSFKSHNIAIKYRPLQLPLFTNEKLECRQSSHVLMF